MEENLFSVKMRAAKKNDGEAHDEHISGAEKIVSEEKLNLICEQLVNRALHHSKGEADFINIKIEKIKPEELVVMDALAVRTIEVESAKEGHEKLCELMQENGIANGRKILELMPQTYGMRGAMLLNVDTMQRLEPDHERGIRATYMDVADDNDDRTKKNHFMEALVLATKVVSHKNIVGEFCISDDPNYITGYFASRKSGYVRITKLKEMGCPDGGRIFLFRGNDTEAAECIKYMEKQKMLIRIENNEPQSEC